MKPAPFEYFQPHSVDEALALLAEHGDDAKPLAGGQSLIPAMNFRLATPGVLVDLNAIGELAYINETTDSLQLGGMTRQRTVERSAVVAKGAPLVTDAMPFIAHAAIRNRGTVGGSLAHADPAAELPAVMLALDATFSVRSRTGTRTVAADDFFVGLFTTAVAAGELLVEVAIRKPTARQGFSITEVSRRHGDFALVGVAASVELDDDGACANARVALFSVGDRPVLAVHAAAALKGQKPTPAAIRAASNAAAVQDIDPSSDLHASAKYRRHLAEVLTRRALTTAFSHIHTS